jgi:hypothetical protein
MQASAINKTAMVAIVKDKVVKLSRVKLRFSFSS